MVRRGEWSELLSTGFGDMLFTEWMKGIAK